MMRDMNWSINNRKKYQQTYYRKNKSKYILRSKLWYQVNKEKKKEYARNWKKRNPEKVRQWKITFYRKHGWKTNYETPEGRRIRSANRRARKRKAQGKFTKEKWEKLKKEYNYTCPICHKKEPEIQLTIDHVIPLINGGTNYISNIQPLCLSCNCKKGTKLSGWKSFKK